MALPDTTVSTYDPAKVVVTFGGVPISGFADETFVSIKRSNGGAFAKKRGADGKVERINKGSYDFTVGITLQQTSSSNLTFDAAMKADMLSNSGKAPLSVTDLNGVTMLTAPEAWVNEDPSVDLGSDTSSRKWVIETGPAPLTIGGNV